MPDDTGFQKLELETNTSNKKTYLLIFLAVIALLVLPTLVFSFYRSRVQILSGPPLNSPTPTSSPAQEATPYPTPSAPITPLPTNTKYISTLLLGRGGDNHSGGNLTDSMTLAVFYPTQAKIILIGIPRDTYIEAGEPKRWMKINRSFSESPENTKKAVEVITGIRVDHYVVIDFDSFIKMIDSLGGVTVNVTTAFDDPYYPIKGEEDNTCGMTPEQLAEVHQKSSGFNLEKQFTCRYENLVFEKGQIKMDGTTALKYVRSRHSGTYGSDFARLERAASVIQALSQNLISKITQNTFLSTYSSIRSFVTTDIFPQNITAWNITNEQAPKVSIQPIPLKADLFINSTSPFGEFILEPKAGRGGWGPIQEYISSYAN